MWVDPGAWAPISVTATSGTNSVTVTATPDAMSVTGLPAGSTVNTRCADGRQRIFGPFPFVGLDRSIHRHRPIQAGNDDVDGRIPTGQQRLLGGTDPADPRPQPRDIALAETPAQNADRTGGRPLVPGQDPQQRGLAGAIGTQQDPMLIRIDPPRNIGKDQSRPAGKRHGLQLY